MLAGRREAPYALWGGECCRAESHHPVCPRNDFGRAGYPARQADWLNSIEDHVSDVSDPGSQLVAGARNIQSMSKCIMEVC